MIKSIYVVAQALLSVLRPIGSDWRVDWHKDRLIVSINNRIKDDFGYVILTIVTIRLNEYSVEVTLREFDYCIELVEEANTYYRAIVTHINMKYQDGLWYANPLANDSTNRAYELRGMIIDAANNPAIKVDRVIL